MCRISSNFPNEKKQRIITDSHLYSIDVLKLYFIHIYVITFLYYIQFFCCLIPWKNIKTEEKCRKFEYWSQFKLFSFFTVGLRCRLWKQCNLFNFLYSLTTKRLFSTQVLFSFNFLFVCFCWESF